MKPRSTISPSKPARPLRQSLRRNSTRTNIPLETGHAEYGYAAIGTRNLPVRKPDIRRVVPAVDLDTAVAARPRENPSPVVPNHEIIEDLYREARDEKFDAFARRIKGIIGQDATADGSSRSYAMP